MWCCSFCLGCWESSDHFESGETMKNLACFVSCVLLSGCGGDSFEIFRDTDGNKCSHEATINHNFKPPKLEMRIDCKCPDGYSIGGVLRDDRVVCVKDSFL